MLRREFLLTAAAAPVALAAPGATTVLYDDHAVALDRIRSDPKELWVRAADLPRINQFELKPQGACRADLCIPISKEAAKAGCLRFWLQWTPAEMAGVLACGLKWRNWETRPP